MLYSLVLLLYLYVVVLGLGELVKFKLIRTIKAVVKDVGNIIMKSVLVALLGVRVQFAVLAVLRVGINYQVHGLGFVS